MKKIILISLISAVAVIMPFINVAEAASRPWCYLIPPFNDCSSGNTGTSVDPYRTTSDPQPIVFPSPTPYPAPTPTPVSYGGTVGRAPIWQNTGSKTVVAGSTLQFNVIATDADGDYLYYSLVNPPAGAWFASNSGVFYWTPSNNQVGTYTLSFSVSDGNNTVYQNVFVTVLSNGQNNNNSTYPPYYVPGDNSGGYAPSWNQTGNKIATVGQYLQFTVYAYSSAGVSYQVLNLPSGARFDTYSQLFSWNPTESQIGNYIVTFRASNNYGTNDMIVNIQVVPANVTPAPVPTPVPTPTPTPTPAPVTPGETRIIFSDIKVENVDGDAIVSWNTNIAATDRVIWDTVSEATLSSNFSYANATPDNTQLSTSHKVNLGKLDVGTTYYIRLVSKTSLQTRVSQEIAFVQLENGQSQNLFGASLFDIFGKLFNNIGFLWLLILGFATAAIVFYRKHKSSNLSV